jgi:strictosidine synthase
MLRWILGGVAALLIILGLAAYGPGALNAQKFTPTQADSDLVALFETVQQPVRREIPDLHGAEDLEPGPDGRLYGSLADGRIMVREAEGGWSEFAHTGGRPLGLSFAPDGALFVADALKGLLRLNADGEFETWLADESEGGPLVFTDDLTVLADGSVILTDASRRYGYGEYMTSLLEGEQTGVIYKVTGPDQYTVLAEGFGFINGVDHDPATHRVYINETWAARVIALDPDTGAYDVLIDGLPGYPDNLEFDEETGLVWIAMPSLRSPQIEGLHGNPFVKRLAWRWIQLAGLPPMPPRPVMGLAVNAQGEPVHALYGPDDAPFGATTVTPWQGRIWISGLERDGVDAYAVPERVQ